MFPSHFISSSRFGGFCRLGLFGRERARYRDPTLTSSPNTGKTCELFLQYAHRTLSAVVKMPPVAAAGGMSGPSTFDKSMKHRSLGKKL